MIVKWNGHAHELHAHIHIQISSIDNSTSSIFTTCHCHRSSFPVSFIEWTHWRTLTIWHVLWQIFANYDGDVESEIGNIYFSALFWTSNKNSLTESNAEHIFGIFHCNWAFVVLTKSMHICTGKYEYTLQVICVRIFETIHAMICLQNDDEKNISKRNSNLARLHRTVTGRKYVF